jgi:hypothetical protein
MCEELHLLLEFRKTINVAIYISLFLFITNCKGDQYSFQNDYFEEKEEYYIHKLSNLKINKIHPMFSLKGFKTFDINGENVGIGFNGTGIEIEGTLFIYKSSNETENEVYAFINFTNKNKENVQEIGGNQIKIHDMAGHSYTVAFDDKYHSMIKKKLISSIFVVRKGEWLIKYRLTQPLESIKKESVLFESLNTDIFKECTKLIVFND